MNIIFAIFINISMLCFSQTFSGLTGKTELIGKDKEIIIKDSNLRSLVIVPGLAEKITIINSNLKLLGLTGEGFLSLELNQSNVAIIESESVSYDVFLTESSVDKISEPFKIGKIYSDVFSSWLMLPLYELKKIASLKLPETYYIFDPTELLCVNGMGETGANQEGSECIGLTAEIFELSESIVNGRAMFFNYLSLESPSGGGFSFQSRWLHFPQFIGNSFNALFFSNIVFDHGIVKDSVLTNIISSFTEFSGTKVIDSLLSRWTFTQTEFNNADFSSTIIRDATANKFRCTGCRITNSSLHFKHAHDVEFINSVIEGSEIDFEEISGRVIFTNVKFLDTDVSHLYGHPKILFKSGVD